MHLVTMFAIFSTRRQAEICRIKWDDYNPERNRVLVPKMKNPGSKGGVNTVVELPDPCSKIIEKLRKWKTDDNRILPFNEGTVSRRFTDACKYLAIDDLHFHDLRHEGTSRLAEMGRTLPQLAIVTGHKAWKSLERYTHIDKLEDKYENWKWLDILE